MRTFYLWITLVLATLPSIAAEPALSAGLMAEAEAVLSLQDALKLALQANPEIAVVMREREAIAGVRIQAGARPNPTISTYIETTGDAAQQTTVQLNQQIELGNKRAARLEAAESRYRAATAAIEAKQAEVHAQVSAAFYAVLAAQERLQLARSLLDIASQAREAAAKRVQAGKVSPVEETKSRVNEATVRIEVTQASSRLNAARKQLSALWSDAVPRFSRVEGDIDNVPGLPSFELLAAKLDQSPQIRLAKLEVETRQALAEIEETRRTQDVTVSIGAQRNEELDANQAVLGFSVPIPIFNQNQGNLQEALSRTDKARDELQALRISLNAELAVRYERIRAAIASAQMLQAEILPGAQSAFDAASKGFLYGKFSYLEVLDAQRTFFEARNQYLSALAEIHQANADIGSILGVAMPIQSAQP